MLEKIKEIEAELTILEIKIRENGNAYQVKVLEDFKQSYKELRLKSNVNTLLYYVR